MNALKTILLTFVILCIFACGIFLGSLFRKPAAPGLPQIQNTATVLRQVQGLSELVTVKYVLEKIVDLPDPKWYGDSKVVLIANGVVKAGIDLKGLPPDAVQVKQKKVTLKLPKAVIFEAFLDDKHTQVLERSTGLLRAFDKDLEQNARRQAVTAISKAARELGIEREAQERGQQQLKTLLLQLGFTEVEFGSP